MKKLRMTRRAEEGLESVTKIGQRAEQFIKFEGKIASELKKGVTSAIANATGQNTTTIEKA